VLYRSSTAGIDDHPEDGDLIPLGKVAEHAEFLPQAAIFGVLKEVGIVLGALGRNLIFAQDNFHREIEGGGQLDDNGCWRALRGGLVVDNRSLGTAEELCEFPLGPAAFLT